MSNETIINTIVNKNLIVVQYIDDTTPDVSDPLSDNFADSDPILCKTRVSINFGKTWKELVLTSNGKKVKHYQPSYAVDEYILGIQSFNRLGDHGATIDFVVRRGDGSRFFLYTPIYYRLVTGYGQAVIMSTPSVTVLGWLVHNERGELVSDTASTPLKSFQRPNSYADYGDIANVVGKDFVYYGENSSDTGINFTTGQIINANNRYISSAFIALPYIPHLCSNAAINPEATKLINQTDTVDYVLNGKRYTIVKKYYTTYFKRGNIYNGYLHKDTPDLINYAGIDYYALVMPFIFVYDHSKIGLNDYSLEWVDVFNLEENCSSCKNSIRGSKKYEYFVRSLISNDPRFNDVTLGPSNTFLNYSANGGSNYWGGFSKYESNIYLDNAAHGGLIKINDKSTNNDVVGLIFGDNRIVCDKDPTIKDNWKKCAVMPGHEHPTVKEAFFYKKLYPGRVDDLSNDENVDIFITEDESGNPVNNYYTYFNVYAYRHPTLFVDVASDRVLAIPFENSSGDVSYRFCCLIKDTSTDRWTIGFKSESMAVGYKALTGQEYSDETFDHSLPSSPVAVSHITGAMFSTSSFIVKASVPPYIDPFLSVPNTVQNSIGQHISEEPFDWDDYTEESEECSGFDLIVTLVHNTTGLKLRRIIETESETCGYTDAGSQMPKKIELTLIKDIVYKFSNVATNKNTYIPFGAIKVQLDAVLDGAGKLIIRSKEDLFYSVSKPIYDKLGFKVVGGYLKITFPNPQYFGLNNSNATHTIAINGTTVINTDKDYVEPYNTSSLLAYGEAVKYEGILAGSVELSPNNFKTLNLTASYYGTDIIFEMVDTDQYSSLSDLLSFTNSKLVMKKNNTVFEPVSGTNNRFTKSSLDSADTLYAVKI